MNPAASIRFARRMGRAALLASAALPLGFAAPAMAADIGDARTTPVETATAENGAPGNVNITANGSITLSTPGPAVRLNSDNTVTNAGDILVPNQSNSVGVLIEGGRTGGFVNSGDVLLNEDYTQTDADNDGDLDGRAASASNRVSVLIDGATPFNGDILNRASGTIGVEGNNSAALRVGPGGVNGMIRSAGALQALGDNSTALDIQGPVTGGVELAGAVGARGEGARGVVIAGDAAYFQSGAAITVSGYNRVDLSNYFDPDETPANFTPLPLEADDLLQGGPAVSIGGNLANGFYISGPFGDAAADDVDGSDPNGKDIRPDYNPNRSTGTINSYGSAPAVLISPDVNPSGGSITIGPAREIVRDTLDDDDDGDTDEILATFQEEHGFVNRGTIAANGLHMDFSSNALTIAGSSDGLRGVTIDGGILNVGTISANAYEADATAIRLGSGVNAGRMNNAGKITATVSTEEADTVRSLLIENGAMMTELLNSGEITADVRGDAGAAVAVEDRSGTLSNIVNDGVVRAFHAADQDDDDGDGEIGDGDELTGRTVAFDLSANTSGVSLLQGSVTTGSAPSITGDILFGAGADVLDVRRGAVNSRLIDFGAGADSLRISGADTTVTGTLRDADGSLAIDVASGTLNIRNDTGLQISSGNFGADSRLTLQVSAEQTDGRVLIASGAVQFANGATLAPTLQDLLLESSEFVLVGASDLQIDGGIESLLSLETAFLYEHTPSLRTVGTEEQLVLNLRRKSAQELGMNANQAAAYLPALEALSASPELSAVFGSLTTREDFFFAYDQVLPEFSGHALQMIAANVQGAAGTIGDRIDVAASTTGPGTGLWAQEYAYYVDRTSDIPGEGYGGGGIGAAIGMDRPLGPFDAVGFNLTASTNQVGEVGGFDQPMEILTAGGAVYAGGRSGGWVYGMTAGAAYDDYSAERRFITDAIDRRIEGEWSGYHLHATAQVAYEADLGWLQIRPQVSVDHIRVSEGGYTETGGGQGLNLVVEGRDSNLTSGTAVLAISHRFGNDNGWWAPWARIGFRAESGSVDDLIARFDGENTTFNMTPDKVPSSGLLAGLGITGGNGFSALNVSVDSDLRKDFVRHVGRASFRMAF